MPQLAAKQREDEKSVPFCLRLHPSSISRLQAVAREEDRSIGSLIRRAIEQYLAQER